MASRADVEKTCKNYMKHGAVSWDCKSNYNTGQTRCWRESQALLVSASVKTRANTFCWSTNLLRLRFRTGRDGFSIRLLGWGREIDCSFGKKVKPHVNLLLICF